MRWRRLAGYLAEAALIVWLAVVHLAACFFLVINVHDRSVRQAALEAGPRGGEVTAVIAVVAGPTIVLWLLAGCGRGCWDCKGLPLQQLARHAGLLLAYTWVFRTPRPARPWLFNKVEKRRFNHVEPTDLC